MPPQRRQERERLAADLLGEPDFYPDEFKSWLVRYIENNPNFRLGLSQLPRVEERRLVGATGQPVFLNGWTNYGSGYAPAYFYKDTLGRVHLGGLLAGGAIGSAAFQLPQNFRPQERLLFAVDSSGGHSRLDIAAGGDVIPVSGANSHFQLDGISFRAF
jgi:hypothetical protein